MVKTFDISIGGESRTLNFNVYCGVELGKILECDPIPEKLMQGLIDLNNRNSMLMFKALIYCGIVGNDYEVGFKQTATQAEVGKWIAEIKGEDLTTIFNAFADALGFNLKAEEVDQRAKATKKKKAK